MHYTIERENQLNTCSISLFNAFLRNLIIDLIEQGKSTCSPRFTNKNPFFSAGVESIHQYPFALEFNLKSTRLCENGMCLIER